MHYAHELVPASEVEVPAKDSKEARASEAEVKMAEKLVAGMTGKWNPTRYRDEYRDDVLALVERKVKSGQTHTIVEEVEKGEPRPSREVVDLMSVLRKSLAERVERGARSRANGKAPRARPRRAAGSGRAARSEPRGRRSA